MSPNTEGLGPRPRLHTLRDDIYQLLSSGAGRFTQENINEFSTDLGRRLGDRLQERQTRTNLRLSNIGKKCARQLWYGVNKPEYAEPLPPYARLKFLFGDIIEALVLFLARVAGHEVKDEQREVDLHGVRGHIDGLIDGTLVDVKSASTYSMSKFRDGINSDNDAFGYLGQLGSYAAGLGREDGAFIAVDKTLGHIVVDHHTFDPDKDWKSVVEERQAMLAKEEPPKRAFNDEPEGKSGNRKLGIECSYCEFKAKCWPGLRTFIYQGRQPTHLTHVVREPRVDEV